MPFGGIAAAVGGSVVGGLFGRSSDKRQQQFSAQQAAQDRDFQAKQQELSQQFAREQQEGAHAFSAQQAGRQMDFQKRMASSQHQRAVSDMRKAGLNPILAAGNPAASPQGAAGAGQTSSAGMASGSRANQPTPQTVAGATTGVQLASAMQAIQKQRAEEKYINAQADRTREQTKRDKAIGTAAESAQPGLDLIKDLTGSAADTARGAVQQMKDLDSNMQKQLQRFEGWLRNRLQDGPRDRNIPRLERK